MYNRGWQKTVTFFAPAQKMETLASELAPALRALYESWRQMGLTTEQQATNMRVRSVVLSLLSFRV